MLVAVLFGGQSGEHEISVISAASVAKALETAGHKCIYLGINRNGQWLQMAKAVSPHDNMPQGRIVIETGSRHFFLIEEKGLKPISVDVVFPVLHGSFGEDGRVQGLLDCLAIPYVGADTLGSAITNDKDVTKRLLKGIGIQVAKHQTLRKPTDISFYEAKDLVGTPLWVKPANLGSSLGMVLVSTNKDYEAAVQAAFALDHKIMIEEHIEGRELECSILQDSNGILVSQAGEILVQGEHYFYDYDAKYNDPDGAKLIIPAKLTEEVTERVKEVALASFTALEGRHIMRVDMFLKSDGTIVVSEVQTIPGFTDISMYPKLLELEGINLPDLTDRLVQQALARN